LADAHVLFGLDRAGLIGRLQSGHPIFELGTSRASPPKLMLPLRFVVADTGEPPLEPAQPFPDVLGSRLKVITATGWLLALRHLERLLAAVARP
jgi:hypothetical protein